MKKPEHETPSNEEIRTFLRQRNITYDFLSPKSELTFTKDPKKGTVRMHLGKNPKTWKEISFDTKDGTMKVEGKEKAFRIDNPTTWQLLEGKDPKHLGLTTRQMKKWTKDYVDMWDDRSTVITNVKNIKQEVVRPSTPETVIPEDKEFQDDVKHEDPNLALGATAPDVADMSSVDVERMDHDHFTRLKKSEDYRNYMQIRGETMQQYNNYITSQEGNLPQGNSYFSRMFRNHDVNQTWKNLNEDYQQQQRNAQGLTSGNTAAVIQGLANYGQYKNNEETAFVNFVYKNLNNDYNDTVGSAYSSPDLIPDRVTMSDVYVALLRNKNIQEFFRFAQTGRGLTKTIIIPDNKEDLLDRLRIIISAKHTGHSDVEDEKHAMLERLLKKKYITPVDYKKISKVSCKKL